MRLCAQTVHVYSTDLLLQPQVAIEGTAVWHFQCCSSSTPDLPTQTLVIQTVLSQKLTGILAVAPPLKLPDIQSYSENTHCCQRAESVQHRSRGSIRGTDTLFPRLSVIVLRWAEYSVNWDSDESDDDWI